VVTKIRSESSAFISEPAKKVCAAWRVAHTTAPYHRRRQ
jgi:hypothetical protein